jgi:hypothetical protein
MKAITRFSLVGASVLSLTVPAPAASTSKADRTASRPAAAKQNTAPTESRTRAPVRSGTDWDFLVGVDRASSPYGHDGY